MVNYNSCIDSLPSRTQNSSPTYSVLKKPIKSKPRTHYFHDSLPPQRSSDLIPPLILIQKKPINLSPRRIMNIKLPNAQGKLKRISSISFENDSFQYSSRSVDLPKAPIVHSTFKHRNVSGITPSIYLQRSVLHKDASQIAFETAKIKERGKSLIRNSSISTGNHGLYESINSFQSFVDSTYRKMYEEIDVSQKGYITLDDFINLVMFIELINPTTGHTSPKNIENFTAVKSKAEEILLLFQNITNSKKITKKDFYSLCSLYEFIKTDTSTLNLMNSETRKELQKKTVEYEKIFQCYAKDNRIHMKDLHNILICLHISDLHQIEGMLYLENIDLSCFFRYLPLFSWIHSNVIKSLNFSN